MRRTVISAYGFVVRASEFPNLLKLGQDLEIIEFEFCRFWTLGHNFSEFWKVFHTRIHTRKEVYYV
jgi:hypothetical protein